MNSLYLMEWVLFNGARHFASTVAQNGQKKRLCIFGTFSFNYVWSWMPSFSNRHGDQLIALKLVSRHGDYNNIMRTSRGSRGGTKRQETRAGSHSRDWWGKKSKQISFLLSWAVCDHWNHTPLCANTNCLAGIYYIFLILNKCLSVITLCVVRSLRS